MQGLTEVVKIGSIFEISQLSLRKNSKDNNAILLWFFPWLQPFRQQTEYWMNTLPNEMKV